MHQGYSSIWKFFFLCLLLLVNSRAVSSDWKTLKNKNGWSIQYPKNWMVEEDYDGNYKLNPPVNGDPDAKDQFSPEICGPVETLKSGKQSGCIRIFSARHTKKSSESASTSKPLDQIMSSWLEKDKTFHGHDSKIQGFPAYDATGVSKLTAKPLPMRKVLVKTNHGIVDIEYYEIKDDRNNFLPASQWLYEKNFEDMLSSISFTK